MKDIYLRSVELSNFRIYGESYAYEFRACPGVTLITGANGLGKTSFFDGLEWALTGQVSRFSDVPVDGRRKELDPLTRVGAAVGSHRVSLQFSDGSPIDRGAGFIPDETHIVQLLKRQGWPEIRNLHGYLSITHFLGQAATRRFTLREPKDQWEALKGPAGVDRINALRERMSGQGARVAFTRAIKERTQQLERSTDAQQNWLAMLAERDRLQQLASSEQPVPPTILGAGIDHLIDSLAQLESRLNWNPPAVTDDPATTIDKFSDLLGTLGDLHRTELDKAESLARLADSFDDCRVEVSALTKLSAEIEIRRTKATSELATAENALADATALLTIRERAVAQEQQRSLTLSKVVATAGQLSATNAQMEALKEQLEKTEHAIAVAQERIDELRGEVEAAATLRTERRILAEGVVLARRRARISATLSNVRTEIVRLQTLVATLNALNLQSLRADKLAEGSRAKEDVTRLAAELAKHDERVQALTEAISVIAHRLTPADTTCPVCASQFSPGQLVQLARAQTAIAGPTAAGLATALVEARAQVDAVTLELAKIERQIADRDQLIATLAEQQSTEQALRQELVDAGGMADSSYNEADSDRLQIELEAFDETLASRQSIEDLQVLLSGAEATLGAEMAKRTTITHELKSVSDSAVSSRASLLQYPDLWTAETGLLIDPSTEQEAANQRAEQIRLETNSAQQSFNDSRGARDTLKLSVTQDTEALGSLKMKLNGVVAKQEDLARRWLAAGQDSEPSRTLAQHFKTQLLEREDRVEAIRREYTRLVSGYRAWLRNEELRELERRLSQILATAGCASESELKVHLKKNIADAERSLTSAQTARDRVESMGQLMLNKAETFTEDVLAPLNTTIQRFARTLMTWSDASIIYRAEHYATRSELRPRIARTEPDGSTIQLEMNPNLYFSEGQLSALSVSALLAASTTFAWSRWRGLLLDDPLQHNDVIHASAFMDLLRQMVRELRYQIVMSTHDSAEADFLIRKCRSAGIPYVVHELLPRGEQGLVSAVA